MSDKETKRLSGLLQLPKEKILFLDAKAREGGYEDLIHYLSQCMIQLYAADWVKEEEKGNKRLEAVAAYARRLALEEN